jgi:hypothetical protein
MILLTLVAAVIIGQAAPAPGETIAADFFYATLGSALVAIPVVIYLRQGERARKTFTRWKDWLLRNNNTLMAVVSLLMGLALVGAGMAELRA